MVDVPNEIALRAGPPKPQPPLVVSLLILAIGFAAPVVFVRNGVPSLFLTIAAILPPIAGLLALYGTIESYRRYQDDRMVRMRALIGPEGIALYRRLGAAPERHPWEEISAGSIIGSALILRLKGEGGGLVRCALRFSALETPMEILQARLNAGLKTTGGGSNQ
jgi:hypothetical protein